MSKELRNPKWCPNCNKCETRIIGTTSTNMFTERTRVCKSCEHTYKTHEFYCQGIAVILRRLEDLQEKTKNLLKLLP